MLVEKAIILALIKWLYRNTRKGKLFSRFFCQIGVDTDLQCLHMNLDYSTPNIPALGHTDYSSKFQR